MNKPLPDFDDDAAVREYAEQMRRYVTETFVKIDNEWARLGQMAGTTVTAAIVTGWLLTVANAGDSMAILDTPKGIIEMVQSHRIQENTEEQERLRAAHAQIAPLGFHLQGPAKPEELGVGPLRLWPGGLCVSRSVGDLDAGALVVPVPHIKQVILPTNGARIIMASDGLWDVLAPTKVAKLARSKEPAAAVSTLIKTASVDRRLADDVSIIIADFLPHENITYPELAHPSGHTHLPEAKGGGFFSCFKGGSSVTTSTAGEASSMELLADVDCLVAYPDVQRVLTRSSLQITKAGGVHRPADYTMHGSSEARVFKEPGKNLQRQRIPEEKGGAPPRAGGAAGDVPGGRDAARASNGDSVAVVVAANK